MILTNLKVLLAERNLSISKVSNDTGISRTTLTALSSNNCKGRVVYVIPVDYFRVTLDYP